MYQHILLAIDDSPTSAKALAEISHIAEPGATVRVVNVVEDPVLTFPSVYSGYYDIESVRDAMLQAGRELLANAERQLRGYGVDVQTRLLDLRELAVDIATAIHDESVRWPADLMVLGTHGRRGARRVLMGSVAEQLMRTATQPVLLVRSDAPAQPAGETSQAAGQAEPQH